MLTITSSSVSTLFYTEVLVSLTTFRWFVFYLYHTDWYQFYLCSPNTLFLQSLFSLFLNDLKSSISISCKGKFDKICSVVWQVPLSRYLIYGCLRIKSVHVKIIRADFTAIWLPIKCRTKYPSKNINSEIEYCN